MMSNKSDETGIRALIYERMPDGSVFDYDRVFDAIDRALAKKEDSMKSTKRYLYQYCDALRDRDVVRERYERLSSPLSYDEKHFIKNPASRLAIAENHALERPSVYDLLDLAEQNCSIAKERVASAIAVLESDDQKIILTAHYLCGADLKWISAVYQHREYWASDLCKKALETIKEHPGDTKVNVCEVDQLADKWERDERDFKDKLSEELPNPPLDDNRMLMGLD